MTSRNKYIIKLCESNCGTAKTSGHCYIIILQCMMLESLFDIEYHFRYRHFCYYLLMVFSNKQYLYTTLRRESF